MVGTNGDPQQNAARDARKSPRRVLPNLYAVIGGRTCRVQNFSDGGMYLSNPPPNLKPDSEIKFELNYPIEPNAVDIILTGTVHRVDEYGFALVNLSPDPIWGYLLRRQLATAGEQSSISHR